MPDTLKDRSNRRLDSLKSQRRSYEPDWQEIAGYCAPARSRFLATSANKGRKSNKRLNNGYGILAFRTLQNGMTAGLSSKSRPWFKLSLYDQDLLDNPQVKLWLKQVESIVYTFLDGTNFYEAIETGYLELGSFGTSACVMIDHKTEVAVCHALTAGEYWLGLNSAMQPGALYRDSGMTVKQTVDTFKKDGTISQRVQSLYDKSDYDCIVPIFHLIEENDDFVEGQLGPIGKPWRSAWFEGWGDELCDEIKVSGYEEQPFWAPRWSTTGADTYGQGPGHDALPDLRELQLQAKREGEITDLMVWPEKVVSSKVKLKNQPKSVVSTDTLDAAKMVTVPYEVPPEALNAVVSKSERLEQRIAQLAHADLFMAISQMDGVQPRNQDEINARLDEKMTQLGPVIERVNGALTIALDRAIGLLTRIGRLPAAPEVLRQSPHIKFDFVSILTQMQRAAGLSQIERSVQFVGGLAGMYPQARFKLDPLAIVDEYADRAGMPSNLVRSTEDANKDADAEKQAQQQAQQAEMMKTVGKPTKDLTDAAALAANLPVASQPVAAQQ